MDLQRFYTLVFWFTMYTSHIVLQSLAVSVRWASDINQTVFRQGDRIHLVCTIDDLRFLSRDTLFFTKTYESRDYHVAAGHQGQGYYRDSTRYDFPLIFHEDHNYATYEMIIMNARPEDSMTVRCQAGPRSTPPVHITVSVPVTDGYIATRNANTQHITRYHSYRPQVKLDASDPNTKLCCAFSIRKSTIKPVLKAWLESVNVTSKFHLEHIDSNDTIMGVPNVIRYSRDYLFCAVPHPEFNGRQLRCTATTPEYDAHGKTVLASLFVLHAAYFHACDRSATGSVGGAAMITCTVSANPKAATKITWSVAGLLIGRLDGPRDQYKDYSMHVVPGTYPETQVVTLKFSNINKGQFGYTFRFHANNDMGGETAILYLREASSSPCSVSVSVLLIIVCLWTSVL